ncbi:MAG: F0F1 ATP synthase subunit I [Yersiniaceae bacterium]|uniref:F0F1 ATP synthase subunit I n=1 Tax=Chimaeribacter coloradensis TaxID=2060068 RepID=A0A2N5E357_9GAMM|nr:F0F1 ATP synthase subunit I [Chimaeribacter coloradensis]MDU6410131.1 F0F1 ATP synthase subunit I [Yersiniaceae bacterium]PLR35135.1 F0F1 ATP synthase subunit I [Chimaeribacter coloradensis]
MSASLYSGKVAVKLLLVQLLTFVLLSAVFGLKGLEWSVSALAGGLAAWLPNALFMLFAWRHQANTPLSGRVAWSFAIGEALKVVITIVLMIIALGVLKAVFIPLGITYLSVLLTQILAPAVINSYRS